MPYLIASWKNQQPAGEEEEGRRGIHVMRQACKLWCVQFAGRSLVCGTGTQPHQHTDLAKQLITYLHRS